MQYRLNLMEYHRYSFTDKKKNIWPWMKKYIVKEVKVIYLFLNDALYKWVYSIFPISSPYFFQNKEMPRTSVIWCKVSIMTTFKTCCFNVIIYAYLLYKNASIYHEIVELYCLVSHALNILFMSWMTYFRLAVGLHIFWHVCMMNTWWN